MRTRWCTRVCVLIILILPIVAEGASIFEDNFEAGNLNKWSAMSGNWTTVASSASAHEGTRGLNIQGNTDPDEDVLTVHLSTIGYPNLGLRYWAKARDGLEVGDIVTVEWSLDAAIWHQLANYTNLPTGEWFQENFPLPAEALNTEIDLRFRATLGGATDRMNFDEIMISSDPVPEPSGLVLVGLLSPFLIRRKR